MQQFKELDDYRKYTGPAELHKAINTLRGLVAGMTTDRSASKEEVDELANWCIAHSNLIHKHPFKELIPLIEHVYEDRIVTEDEAKDILWLCNNFVTESTYYDLITGSIQFLQGLIHGIMADEEISDTEIHALKKWITTNDFLMGTYPFDEIESLSVTLFLIGKHSSENEGFEYSYEDKCYYNKQNFIIRELKATLYDGKGNRRSGLLGIVLPDMYDAIYGGNYTCTCCGEEINIVRINSNTVIKEFSENYYLSPNCKDGHCDESGRYCVLVKYDDFMKSPDTYINKAYDKSNAEICNSVHWKDIDHVYKKRYL